jgi:hypothetical protein
MNEMSSREKAMVGHTFTRLLQMSIFALAAFAMPAASSVANAQEKKRDEPLMVFLTEEVRAAQDAREVAFWWKDFSSPVWTETDRALTRALERSGGVVAKPGAAGKKVSRLYSTPYLPDENAASLAGLLGSSDAFVGAVIYEVIPSELPVAKVGWRALVSLELVDAATQRPVGQRIVIERVVFANNKDAGLKEARAQVADGLAKLMLRTRQRAKGPVGLAADTEREEPYVVLRKGERSAALETLRRSLLAVEGVDDVVVRWVARGHIALEINPGKEDDPLLVQRAVQAVTEQPPGPVNFAIGQDASVQNAILIDLVEQVAPPTE